MPGLLAETPLHGDWRIELEEGSLRVPAGSSVVIAPGVRHRLVAEVARPSGMVSTWVYLRWEIDGVPLSLAEEAHLFPKGCVARYVDALARPQADPESATALVSQALFQAAGLQLLAEVAGVMRVQASPDPRVARAVQLAHQRLDHPLSRSDLARVAGLSETRFHAVFRSVVGEPPMRHLQRLRLQRSLALLERSGLSLGEIANQCGFSSPEYFSRQFRALIGMPPGAYRRRLCRRRPDREDPHAG